MKINYAYIGIGLLVVVGGYLLLKKKGNNDTPPNTGINLDNATLKTFVEWLRDRGYTVDQLPMDVKKDLTPEQIEEIKVALLNYKP